VIDKTIERYQTALKTPTIGPAKGLDANMQNLKDETADLRKKIELLEVSERMLMGESLDSCSKEELQQLEQQLEQSLKNIRARKIKLFEEQIDHLKQQEEHLMKENAELKKRVDSEQHSINFINFV
ncbi:Agamous-like MADS-box protein AGL19, partial [Striga hermonthica]